jgi:hypothetical protein
MVETNRKFLPQIQAVIEEFIPICRRLAGDQPYAIAVSGSLGKGTWDARSDIDFRLYTAKALEAIEDRPGMWDEYREAEQRWKAKGVIIDGIWPRTINEVDKVIASWCAGHINPWPLVWTIWGYYPLPDMFHQSIVEDPYNIIGTWKQRLSVYPPLLKQATLKKYRQSLEYWRSDYHYLHKVERGDVVFTAGMSSKLLHEIFQILYALNETYYVGDGSNLDFCASFPIKPDDLTQKVTAILYPPAGDALPTQYHLLCSLIDDVLGLMKNNQPEQKT